MILGDVDRYGFYEAMKTYTAAPPDVLRIDQKFMQETYVVNVVGIVMTTNDKAGGIYRFNAGTHESRSSSAAPFASLHRGGSNDYHRLSSPQRGCSSVKPNGGMGSLYRSRHELVFVFGKSGARRQNNVQLGRFGRNRSNVWNYPGINSFARRGRTRGLEFHPTVKPIAMVADAILDATQRGDIVLDPFCGSGTTILAAERVGRRSFAMELDPLYVDLTISRWQRMTKQTAIHASGKTFDAMRAERRGADGQD